MNSKTTVVAVVVGLIAIALALIIGAFVLVNGNHDVPGAVWTLAGTAVGGLVALLTNTNSTINVAKEKVPEAPAPAPVVTNVTNARVADPLAGKLP